MAKRNAGGRKPSTSLRRRSSRARRLVKRQKSSGRRAVKATARKGRTSKKGARSGTKSTARSKPTGRAGSASRPVPARTSRLEGARRTPEDTVPTPPSSLNMDRHGSAARTGRAELQDNLRKHTGMTPALTGGDVDANWENAYFSGEEAPGGDNPTPDQGIVDDIGKALGVQYQDNEELKAADKVAARDKHRWELDPASAEDYKERK